MHAGKRPDRIEFRVVSFSRLQNVLSFRSSSLLTGALAHHFPYHGHVYFCLQCCEGISWAAARSSCEVWLQAIVGIVFFLGSSAAQSRCILHAASIPLRFAGDFQVSYVCRHLASEQETKFFKGAVKFEFQCFTGTGQIAKRTVLSGLFPLSQGNTTATPKVNVVCALVVFTPGSTARFSFSLSALPAIRLINMGQMKLIFWSAHFRI